ncbi:hypothetical protein PAPYR_7479 [Paratrimastix pyriformis]|uniref:Transmembrane protein n=1 Tax=Paratrimastix pyriformis TaxID=342808 RepID=A0ABQ8UFN6_9EUKA|nr:hypothetical protein PAPYR_7479 [Paratrimastix pyriformis]
MSDPGTVPLSTQLLPGDQEVRYRPSKFTKAELLIKENAHTIQRKTKRLVRVSFMLNAIMILGTLITIGVSAGFSGRPPLHNLAGAHFPPVNSYTNPQFLAETVHETIFPLPKVVVCPSLPSARLFNWGRYSRVASDWSGPLAVAQYDGVSVVPNITAPSTTTTCWVLTALGTAGANFSFQSTDTHVFMWNMTHTPGSALEMARALQYLVLVVVDEDPFLSPSSARQQQQVSGPRTLALDASGTVLGPGTGLMARLTRTRSIFRNGTVATGWRITGTPFSPVGVSSFVDADGLAHTWGAMILSLESNDILQHTETVSIPWSKPLFNGLTFYLYYSFAAALIQQIFSRHIWPTYRCECGCMACQCDHDRILRQKAEEEAAASQMPEENQTA